MDENAGSTDYSADGAIVAGGGYDGLVALYEASSGRHIATLDPGTERAETVEDVAFTPDGAVLVSTSWDGTAKMWDVGTHEQIGTLRGHEDKVGSVDISHDGSLIVTGGADGTARIWDLEGHPLKVLRGHRGEDQ